MGTSPSRGLVVFRADASPEIGGGHVVRCLALAEHLQARGWPCVFTVRAPTLATVPALESSGHSVVELRGDLHDEAHEIEDRVGEQADWLVVDHYERDASFERAARAWARRVLAIDDAPGRGHDCDLLLDQTIGRQAGPYSAQVPDRCRLLLGPRYALLRAQFPAARAAALARRKESTGIERIIVSFGASDRHGLTLAALEGIRTAGLRVAVDVVLGRGWPHRAMVHEAAASLPVEIAVHEEVSDMASLMTRADLAIGAAGSTAWERCCLGLPTLMIVVACNQADIADGLAGAGAARTVADLEGFTPEALGRAVAELAGDPELLMRMSDAAARVCDGSGTARVAEIMVSAP